MKLMLYTSQRHLQLHLSQQQWRKLRQVRPQISMRPSQQSRTLSTPLIVVTIEADAEEAEAAAEEVTEEVKIKIKILTPTKNLKVPHPHGLPPDMLMGPQVTPVLTIILMGVLRTIVLTPSPVAGRPSLQTQDPSLSTNEIQDILMLNTILTP